MTKDKFCRAMCRKFSTGELTHSWGVNTGGKFKARVEIEEVYIPITKEYFFRVSSESIDDMWNDEEFIDPREAIIRYMSLCEKYELCRYDD